MTCILETSDTSEIFSHFWWPLKFPFVSILSLSDLPQWLILIDFPFFVPRTAVPMLEEQLSPAFQQGAVVVTETGLCGTAKDATRIITVMKWGLPQRPTSIRPPLHPSTLGSVVQRSLCVLWRLWLGNMPFISTLPWKHSLHFELPCSHWDV